MIAADQDFGRVGSQTSLSAK